MNKKTELLCGRIEATNAELRLRREIFLTTNKTPEMLAKQAKRQPLKEHERLLLEAWQGADEAMRMAIRLHEAEAEKGGGGHEREA